MWITIGACIGNKDHPEPTAKYCLTQQKIKDLGICFNLFEHTKLSVTNN
jgi:hypothetical protein